MSVFNTNIKSIFLSIVFALSAFPALDAQSVQKVRVVEYKGEQAKTPLANVEVMVTNAGSTVTDKNGYCTLDFRTLKPGDKVSVRRIVLPGYQVFNTEALNQWYISRTGDTFVIVLCSQERLASLRKNFTSTAEKALRQEQNLQSQEIKSNLNKGLISKAEYDKRIHELEAEYEEKLEDLDNYIERLVHTDLAEVDQTERKVLDMVQKGDILGALAQYETADLIKSYKQEVQTVSKIDNSITKLEDKSKEMHSTLNRIYESVKRQNALLIIQGGEENIEKGFALLREIAFSDTTNYTPLLDYARYCAESIRTKEALEAAHYCHNSSDPLIRNRAGLIECQAYHLDQRWDLCRIRAEECIDYFETQSQEKDAKYLYLDERAEAYRLLLLALVGLREKDLSDQIEKKCVQLRRDIVELNPNDDNAVRELVNTLYSAYRNIRRYSNEPVDRIKEGVDYLQEAITFQSLLYGKYKSRQAAMLALLHSTMAGLYRDSETQYYDTDKCVDEYELAGVLYNEAYEKDPQAYVGFLALNYINYAGLYIYELKDRNALAKPLLDKGMAMLNEEFRFRPNTSRNKYANSLVYVADYYVNEGDIEQAVKNYKLALVELEGLSQKNPQIYKVKVNDTFEKIKKLESMISR